MLTGASFLLVQAAAAIVATAPAAPEIRANDNRAIAGRLANGVLTVSLVARQGIWSPEGDKGPGIPVFAFAEEGKPLVVPGPMLRVSAGTELRITVRNTLPETLCLRGLQDHASTALDTVDIAPGASREIQFRAVTPGTFYYWARTNRTSSGFGDESDSQLVGAFIVDPPGTAPTRGERVMVISLWHDSLRVAGVNEGLKETIVVNGLSWPYTERLSYSVGDTARWRVINASPAPHPMHLHGFYFAVDSKGDANRDTVYTWAQQRLAVTEFMMPGATMALRWVPTRAGNWLFHCHLIYHIDAQLRLTKRAAPEHEHNHALSEMAGLVMGIHVSPAKGAAAMAPDPVARRRLRLVATERAAVFGNKPGFSFILQEGEREPARDSVRFPSSTILLRRNEPTEITVVNRMTKNFASVHWHGIELESFYDGVSGWSGAGERVAPIVAPNDSFVVRLTPDRAGTFIYHTHADETLQLTSGLYGPLLVLGETEQPDSTDRVFLIGDAGPPLDARAPVAPFVNGSTSPPPVELQAGTNYLFRLVSISSAQVRRVRLVSESGAVLWDAVAKDGADLPSRQAFARTASIDLGPGETADFRVRRPTRELLTMEVISAPRSRAPNVLKVPVIVR